jgi:hypothetical protein
MVEDRAEETGIQLSCAWCGRVDARMAGESAPRSPVGGNNAPSVCTEVAEIVRTS